LQVTPDYSAIGHVKKVGKRPMRETVIFAECNRNLGASRRQRQQSQRWEKAHVIPLHTLGNNATIISGISGQGVG